MLVIDVQNLSKTYGPVHALKDVSFAVEKGEVLGLLGLNGAGKTTLMKLLTGYLQPDSGKATVCGQDVVSNVLQVQKNIGYLPENAPLYPEMAVQEYLQMMAALREIPQEKQRALLSEAIYATGLENFLTKRIGNLSKGYRQRVGIAQAILHKPKLLILDEPTTGLDPTQLVEIRALIRRLAENATVMLSTHILHEVELTCERALVLMNGILRADVKMSELGTGKAVTVTIGNEADGVASFLESIDGITQAQSNPGRSGYNVWRVVGEGDDLAPRLFDALRTKTDWKVAGLVPEEQSLETMFHELAQSA